MSADTQHKLQVEIHNYLDTHVAGVTTERIVNDFEDASFDEVASALKQLQDEKSVVNRKSYGYEDEVHEKDEWQWLPR